MCKCRFCHREKMVTDFVYEDELVTAFMDMEPINDELAYLMSVSKKIVKAIKAIYKPDGYTIMQNGGLFNDVGHYHLHIFPRYVNDGFGWNYGEEKKKVNSEIAERIRNTILLEQI